MPILLAILNPINRLLTTVIKLVLLRSSEPDREPDRESVREPDRGSVPLAL